MVKYTARQITLKSEVTKYIKKREQRWKEYWQPLHKLYRRLYRLYLAKNELTTLNRRARLTLSLGFEIIENVAAETHSALFDEQPYIKQKPVGPEDELQAEEVSDHIAHQAERAYLKLNALTFEKNRLMFGLSFAAIPWNRCLAWKRRMRPVMEPVMISPPTNNDGTPLIDPSTKRPFEPTPRIDPMTGKAMMQPRMGMDGQPVEEKKWVKEVIDDNWAFETLMPWEIIVDPAINDPMKIQTKGEGFIRHRWYSTDELKREQREGRFIKGSVDEYFAHQKNRDANDSFGDATVHEEDEDTDRDLGAEHSHKKGLHHVLEFWGPLSVKTVKKKNGEEELAWDDATERVECLASIAADAPVMFRCKRNPIDEQLRPIIASNCHPQAGRLPSPGLLQAVESDLRELMTMRNVRLDNLTQKMNPMYFARLGAIGLNTKKLKYEPFKILRTANPKEDLLEAPTPDLGATFTRDMGDVRFGIQEATASISASQSSTNMSPAFARSATGINFLQNRMDKRLNKIVEVGEAQIFGSLSDLINSYNQQFLTEPEHFTSPSKENVYRTITPEAYMKKRDFLPVGAQRKLKKGVAIQIIDRMLTELSAFADEIKIPVILRELIKYTEIFPNPDRILYTDEEKAKRSAMKPPEVKKGINLSISWEQLTDVRREAFLKALMPEVAQSEDQVEQEQAQAQANTAPEQLPLVG